MKGIDKNLVAIIMAGGVGTRFWTLSTQERPKQCLHDNKGVADEDEYTFNRNCFY